MKISLDSFAIYKHQCLIQASFLVTIVADKVNFKFQLSTLTILGNNEMFQTSIKLLQELHIFHIHLIHSALMLVQSKVAIHKLNLKQSLGFNLGWCKVLKMPFQLLVALSNISELISKWFSNCFFSALRFTGLLLWVCNLKAVSELPVTNLLIYIGGDVVCVCFSASTASDWPSWSSGPRETFEETSKVHFIFLLCWVFVGFLLGLLKTVFMANAHPCHHVVFDFKLGKYESNTQFCFPFWDIWISLQALGKE